MENQTFLRILHVEDDRRLAELTREYLQKNGAVVELAFDGNSGLAMARRNEYDLVLLDIMLPGLDGIQVCQQLRSSSDVPIIITTARGEEADTVLGLELGADDYVTKPFSPRELLARIRAAVRRARGLTTPAKTALNKGGVSIDPQTRVATLNESDIELTAYEFSILYILMENAGRILSRERLMELAGGSPEESFDRSIDVHISRLRKKLGNRSTGEQLIRTVRGAGYVFSAGDGR